MRSGSIRAAALSAVLLVLFAPGVASAHTDEEVGELELEVGFRDEPVYVGIPNAVFVELSRGGEPITDLGDSLTVTVAFGDQTSDPMTFQPMEEPGQYQAPFVPSQAGAYTFTYTGRVDGTKVDLEVTSGPKTFEEAVDLSTAAFPPTDVPTVSEMADRIDRESARAADAAGRALEAAQRAEDSASSATTVGYVAIAVGALGVVLGSIGLAGSRRRSPR